MDILTWDDWCEVFDDFNYFKEIIDTIFEKHNLGNVASYKTLTPGTNAVFKVNEFVVKIYVPNETSIWETDEYLAELEYMKFARERNIVTPNVICNGELQMDQSWRYSVFEYIDGVELGEVVSSLSREELLPVLDKLKHFINQFHVKSKSDEPTIFIGLEKDFWEPFTVRFMQNARNYLSQKDFHHCLTHGDLTGDNLLYNGDLYFIDFADASITPEAYEYPPLVFDLLHYDLNSAMYLVDNDFHLLIEYLVDGILVHEFGGDMLRDILKRLHIDPIELIDVEDVKNAVIDILK